MPKRSLMLAGGGVKIAFQAGVLQVWLDEAGLTFDHCDGVSAACFNVAMWAQGMSGTRIADNWRNADPIMGVDVHWTQLAKLIYAESLFEFDAYRKKVFPSWGLDFETIRNGGREATFNIYNFSKHELRPVTAPELTEDHLVATGSLPIWFPPVRIDGDTYIDAVFNTACNIEEAIRRGADELWVIWTTSQRGEWFDGFVGNFFGIFEAVTVGGYKAMLARIARNNERIARGEHGEFERPIIVRELKAEVPLHYLLNFSKDRVAECVNRGVEAARAWCDANGIARTTGAAVQTEIRTAPTSLRFTQKLKGYVGLGEQDPRSGFAAGRADGTLVEAVLKIHIDDVDRFITMPEHEASTEGVIVCDSLGGKRPIARGTFNLFTDSGDPTHRQILHRIELEDGDGRALTLSAAAEVHDEPGFDAWSDTTTLFTTISAGEELLAAGILRLSMIDFLEQLTTLRTEGPSLADRASAVARFGLMYLGKLWDVYARRVLTSGPI